MRSLFPLALFFSVQLPLNCALVAPKFDARRWRLLQRGSRGVLTPRSIQRSSPLHLLESRGGAQLPSSPKLLTWIGPALTSAFLMALYSNCIKLSSATIHPILGGFILQFVAVVLGGLLLGVSTARENSGLQLERSGVLWSVCAGLAVGAAELVSFHVSGMGVQASQSIPVMIGGSVAFGSVIGAALLKERMGIQGWFGVLLVVLGIVCVATDSGAKIGH